MSNSQIKNKVKSYKAMSFLFEDNKGKDELEDSEKSVVLPKGLIQKRRTNTKQNSMAVETQPSTEKIKKTPKKMIINIPNPNHLGETLIKNSLILPTIETPVEIRH